MSSLFTLMSVFLLFNLVQSANGRRGPIASDCFDCLCQATSNCTDLPCEKGKGCGYMKLTKEHWRMCMRPRGDYESCAHDLDCTASCLQVYVALYSYWCGGHSCQHISRLISEGRRGCTRQGPSPFWQSVKQCLADKH